MTASGGVHVRREADGIAEVVLGRPEAMNALSTATLDQLATAFTAVAAGPSVRGVVLSAAGGRAVCVGAGLKERAAMRDAPIIAQPPTVQAAVRALLPPPQPVIAAVDRVPLG